MRTRAPALALLVFGALILIMESALSGYWHWLLEPRLRSEAASQAQVLAQAQAPLLAQALALEDPTQRVLALDEAVDSLLLLRAPGRDEAFFEALNLRVDAEQIGAEPGSLDRRTGDPSTSGFTVKVELYHPLLASLVGVAEFSVSPAFYWAFSADVRQQLYWQGLFIAILLGSLGGALAWILGLLDQQQAARSAAELALATHERQLKQLMDNLDTYFVYGRDANGQIISVSDSVQQVIGVGPEEFLRRRVELLTDNPINRQSLARLQSPRQRGSEQFEFELRDPDGALHRLECTEVLVRDDQGNIKSIDGIAHDVTAQRRLEAELRSARDQAELANRSKSQFLANMSHEIRTPMNAVIGMATLMGKSPLTSRQRSQLGQLEASARMLMGIIDDILDLSRIEAGKLTIINREFVLDELLTDLTSLVGQRARDKGLDVLIDADPGIPSRLVGDAMRLQQVLVNLTVNAIKFTERGEVVIEIGILERTATSLTLRFAVRDSGIGVPPEMLPRLFEQFTQMDESSTRKHGGAGLGLAISKRLVALMGGEMDAQSAPGKGSTFWFTAQFDLVAEQAPRGAGALRPGLRALVVDDSPVSRDVFGSMLESLRFEVTLAETAERALDLMQANGSAFDLLVIDYLLPGRNGIEAVRELKRRRRCPPSLMITAYADDALAAEAEQAGIDGFLQKPVSPSTLHDATVRVLMSDPKLPRAVASARGTGSDVRFAAGQRVLLVEDNEINRQVAGELLRGLGLDVETAENGLVALHMLANPAAAFAVILMDVQMPELDGIETTRRIKQDARCAAIPVIALTAHAMASDRERFLAAGMDDYLSKPIEERDLVRALARWLRTTDAGVTAATTAVESDDGLPQLEGVDVRAAVSRLNGKLELFLRLFNDFLGRYRNVVEQVRELLGNDQQRQALDLVHGLKGAAATLGAKELAQAAADFERVANDSAELDAALGRIDAALRRIDRPGQQQSEPELSPAGIDVSRESVAQAMAELARAIDERRYEAGRGAEALLRMLSATLRANPAADALRNAMACLDFASASTHLDVLRLQFSSEEHSP